MATTMPQIRTEIVPDDGTDLLEALLANSEISVVRAATGIPDLGELTPRVDLGGYADYLDWPEKIQ